MQNKQIHKFMKEKSFVASKKMGQNFLSSLPIKKRIVDSAKLKKNDFVLEIGPGLGAITEILLSNPIKLLAVELDKRLFDHLTQKFASYENFSIVNNDVLKEDLQSIIEQKSSGKNAIVVANLPYSISSKIVLKLMKTINVERCIIMVQKEMAERLAAKVNTKDYNAFTALVSLYLDVNYLFTVGPKNFVPAPKVDSAVIELTRINNNDVSLDKIKEYEIFFRQCFQNKRKTLVNNLQSIYDKQKVQEILLKMNLSPTIRAEAISAKILVEVYNNLNNES